MAKVKYITVRLTTYQAACLAEYAGSSVGEEWGQRRQDKATLAAIKRIEKALEKAGEPWPL